MKFRFALLLLLCLGAPSLWAHCQIPCGIYGDEIRLQLLEEHVRTIEKSMAQIRELGAKGEDFHPMIRWTVNKEEHAEKIIRLVSDYFLAQRVKPLAEGRVARKRRQEYFAQLVTLHEIIVHAMKAKQSTDEKQVKDLQRLVTRFRYLYLKKEGK